MTARHAPSNQGVGTVRGMFMFVLLAMFALLSVVVLLVGTRVYRAVASRGDDNYEMRTALSYVASKVRAMDTAGQIETLSMDGTDVLALGAEYNGIAYVTYIYVYEGHLMEYFGRRNSEFSLSYGERIATAQGFTSGIQGRLLTITITRSDGAYETMRLYLQSEETAP